MSASVAPTATKDGRATRKKSGNSKATIVSICSIVGGITLWWLLSLVPGTLLPGPLQVVTRFVELVSDGTWFSDLGASLQRVLLGFFIGAGLAIPLGFAMGWYWQVRAVIEPWTQFFRTIPPLAIIPVAIILMGIGELPKVFVITLASFLVAIIATFQGVLNVDKTLINAGRVLGASDMVIFRRIAVPASTPFIMVGLRQALGSAWATLVAAELIAADGGLGYRMQSAQVYNDLPTIFVSLVTIGVFGLFMDRALLWLDTKLTSWQERR